MWHVVHHTLGILVIVPRVASPPSSTRRISMRRSWGRSTGRSMSNLASVGAASGTASSCRGRMPGFIRAAFAMLTRELSQKYTNSTTGATLTADDKYGASQASQHFDRAIACCLRLLPDDETSSWSKGCEWNAVVSIHLHRATTRKRRNLGSYEPSCTWPCRPHDDDLSW